MLTIYLAESWGFCFGVERALKVVEKTREKTAGAVYILKEIVHNTTIVKNLNERNIRSIPSADEVSEGTLIISAHGISPQMREKIMNKGLNVVDTTCPLVTRIHKSAKNFADQGYSVILYGDKKHDEVIGVLGEAPDKIFVIADETELDSLPRFNGKLALISQSTQSMEVFDLIESKLKEKYPHLVVENTICDPTQKRQNAVLDLAPRVDLMIVVGSQNSSNSVRLLELSRSLCPQAYLINTAGEVQPEWFEKVTKAGLTAGASTPDFLVKDIILKMGEFVKIKEVVHYKKEN